MKYPEDFINKIICGDCLEVMKDIPDKSVDLVLTDPPYGIEYKSNMGTKQYQEKIQTAKKWDKKGFDFREYLKEIWRLMKNDSDLYVFGNWKNFNLTKEGGFKQILIWDKRTTGMGDLTSWGIGYELIYYFKKGNRPVNKRKSPVIPCESLTSFTFGNPLDNYFHPTQKPLGIIEPLILVSSNENETILDPFMGSGTTAVACKHLKRNFIGIEISPEYCKIARQRLRQEVLF